MFLKHNYQFIDFYLKKCSKKYMLGSANINLTLKGAGEVFVNISSKSTF